MLLYCCNEMENFCVCVYRLFNTGMTMTTKPLAIVPAVGVFFGWAILLCVGARGERDMGFLWPRRSIPCKLFYEKESGVDQLRCQNFYVYPKIDIQELLNYHFAQGGSFVQ